MKNLKEIDGKYYRQCKVVMLPTEDKSFLYLDREGSKLGSYNKPEASVDEFISQGICVITDDEIKEGDHFISSRTRYLLRKGAVLPTNLKVGHRKIVASTDTLLDYKAGIDVGLFLPNLSKYFIKQFIERYNAGDKIEDVLIEYEDKGKVMYEEYGGMVDSTWIPNMQLKINNDNSINIKEVKNTYSREEVIELLSNCWLQATRKTLEPLGEKGMTTFIQENLS